MMHCIEWFCDLMNISH